MMSGRVLVSTTVLLLLSIVSVTWQQLHAQDHVTRFTVPRPNGNHEEPAPAKNQLRRFESQSVKRGAHPVMNRPDNVAAVMRPPLRLLPMPTNTFAPRCTTCGSRAYQSQRSVDRWTGIPGMRVSEWRSPTSGLTLSEEQQFGVAEINHTVVDSHCAPCNNWTSAQSSLLHGSYFNIPDSVW